MVLSLKERLNDDIKTSMKKQDKQTLTVLRMVKSAMRYKEIDQKIELDDTEISDIINKEIKLRNDSLADYIKAGRGEQVAVIRHEIDILRTYLPEQLGEYELRQIVQEIVEETKADGKKDMGKVMKAIMPKVKGLADGKLVNDIVNEILQ